MMASGDEANWLPMNSMKVLNDSRLDTIPQQDAAIMDFNLSSAHTNRGSDVSYTSGSRYDLIHNELVQATFCFLYLVIFVLGIFGNVLVCFVVFRNKAMQTVTNLFITNLALSDILLCILAVPFTPLYTFLRGWVFGTMLCHLVPYAQGCSVYISTLTLTSIAIDRFFVIIYPFHPRMRLATCICIIVSIWGFSLLVTLPYGLYMKVLPMNHTGVWQNYCEEDWPSEQYRKIFGSFNSTLQFVIPFLIISICYTCVSIKLNDRARTKPGSKTSRREAADRDRKKRTNRMLIAMVAVFGISWLPLNVVNIFNDFTTKTEEWPFYNVFFFISHCVAMSSTCYNPFLYAWLNENFRKEFKLVLPCFHPTTRRNGLLPMGTKWRSERTCNGNNETVQESLLPSSYIRSSGITDIIPRGPTGHDDDRVPIKMFNSVDTILLSEVAPPAPISGTVILPSGVLETQFDASSLPPLTARSPTSVF
ncbi:prolactin-releasing peptide receptor-like [Phlebotomus papatasi]|uniref:prolactin-releasing peptide receptor-like n=1 Tax=Phlebotomus papatasi TaxID=29031 RepID=UPI002484333D|nr:prolactin-releasing peptide receptor-like [Phlebotomus papatasi]XP_055706557.1 prolactin-releasing peptide receptor-like [Phlebotomus papatasi]